MPQNDFLPFAYGNGANVISQPEYVSLGLVNGFQSGIALSEQCNKIWRQSSIMGASLAQFIMDNSGNSVIDDGTIFTIENNLKLAVQNVTRTKATGDTNFYVNTSSGNNTNNGLTPSTAFKTINSAIAHVYTNWDFNGFTATVNIANGTYNEAVKTLGMPVGCPILFFTGNNNSPASVIINSINDVGWLINLGGYVFISGVTIGASGTSNNFATQGYGMISTASYAVLNNVVFNTCTYAQCCTNGGIITALAGSSIGFSGTAQVAIQSQVGGLVWFVGSTVNFAPGATYSNANVLSIWCANVHLTNAIFTGSIPTGRRYYSTRNSNIDVSGAGINFIPGTIAGATDNGGTYL